MTPVYLLPSRPSGKLPKGSSKFWGNPDLPSGCSFPSYIDCEGVSRPYFFICQINLEDFSRYDTDCLLPHVGLLSFFAKIGCHLGHYDEEECIGGTISEADAVKVMYLPDSETLKETAVPEIYMYHPVPDELGISFSLDPAESQEEHALFAPPTHRPWETWDHPFEDRQILLQVDSFEGDDFVLNFMDVGVLDFLISPSDLKSRNFSDVRAIVLSS